MMLGMRRRNGICTDRRGESGAKEGSSLACVGLAKPEAGSWSGAKCNGSTGRGEGINGTKQTRCLARVCGGSLFRKAKLSLRRLLLLLLLLLLAEKASTWLRPAELKCTGSRKKRGRLLAQLLGHATCNNAAETWLGHSFIAISVIQETNAFERLIFLVCAY